jgi:hypothetical protein
MPCRLLKGVVTLFIGARTLFNEALNISDHAI